MCVKMIIEEVDDVVREHDWLHRSEHRATCNVIFSGPSQAHLIGCWQYLGPVCFWQPLG